MKIILFLIFTCLSCQIVSAKNERENLYQDFLKKYKAEQQADILFPQSMLIACDKTVSINNEVCKGVLHIYTITDSGIANLAKYVVERFMNEDLMKMECNEDISEFSEVFSLYTDAECNCMTNKNEELKRRNIQIEFGSVGSIEGCIREISENKNLTQAIRNLHPDVEKLNKAAHCQVIYAYTHCALLKQEMMKLCINHSYANYKQEVQKKDDEFIQALRYALIHEDGSSLNAFYADRYYLKHAQVAIHNVALQHRFLFNGQSISDLDKKVLHTVHQENGNWVLTFMYVSANPQLLMQVQMKNAWNITHDKIIGEIIVLNGKQIANKEKYLNYFKDLGNEPPEVRELK